MGKKLYRLGIMVIFCLLIIVGFIACGKDVMEPVNSAEEENVIDPDDSAEEEYEEINFGSMLSLERESEKKIEVDGTAYNLSFSPDGSRFVYYQAFLWPLARVVDINGKEYELLPLETDNASRGAVSWYDDHKLAYVSLSGFKHDPENLKSHVYFYDPDSEKTDIIESPVRMVDNIGVAMINSKSLLAMSLEGLYRYSLEEDKWDMFASIPDSFTEFLWSGDYSKAVYTTMLESGRDFYTLETSTGQQNMIRLDYPVIDYCWSHGPDRLALVCKDEEKNSFIIAILKPDGTEVYSKTIKGVNSVESIKWVPNSEKISFWLGDDEGGHLRIVDLQNDLAYFDKKLSGWAQWSSFDYVWLSENRLAYLERVDPKPSVHIVSYKP